MFRTTPLLTSLLLLFACKGLDGKDGANGMDGQDGTPGADGLDGQNGADGTDGTNGNDGSNGSNGEDGEDLTAEPSELDVTISGVEIGTSTVVTFSVANEDGEAFNRLSEASMRFAIAKLVPGENGDADAWKSYINTTASTSTSTAGPNGVPVLASATQATTESDGTLAYMGGGVYTYTFADDITNVTSPEVVEYDDSLLHRVAIQIEFPLESGEELILNPTFDWVPNGGTAAATRSIVKTDSCNECHDQLAIHGGGRIEVDYCVTCHNPGTTDPNSGNTVDLTQMVHKIHMGSELTEVTEGGSYIIWGYRDGENDYSHVGYPQDQQNCVKCHDPSDAETPDAINYLEKPTMEACGSCHDAVDFATGENHDGGAMTSNATCYMCHSSTAIDEYHRTENATPHNPDVPDGLSVFEYEIVSATMDADNTLTVEYVVTRDGTAINCASLDSDITGGPSFLLAWAQPIDGFDAPSDWNNLGKKAGQPASVSVSSLVAGSVSGGTHSYSGGVNTMVYASAFPEGATMRTVALQGYYSQTLDGSSYGRHTVSKYMTVDGDEERRVVVDPDNCANCHEWFEGHGGNRVYETQVCAMCHNTSLSSSGRELDLTHPESSNNLKDMIHGIHGSSVRDEPLDFVRNRSGGLRYTFLGSADQLEDYPDGHLVEYPAGPANCNMCHTDDSHLVESIPEQALLSTHLMGDEATTTTEYTAFRTSMPNDTDWVMGPASAACSSCHWSDLALAHMDQNGGSTLSSRAEWEEDQPMETCELCHGEGRTASVNEFHGLE